MKKLYTALALLATLAAGDSYAQTVNLKSGTTSIGTYTTIQAAYNAIPATLTQPYTIEVLTSYNSTLETFPVTFTNKAGASSTNTITIKPGPPSPAASVQVLATASAAAVFVLDNADWIVIDGVTQFDPTTGSPNFLLGTVGTAVPAPYVIGLKNGSCNNVIKNSVIVGFSSGTSISFGTSPTEASGNSNNAIEHNLIASSYSGIFSNGTVANPNSHLSVMGNTLYPTAIGVHLQEGTGYAMIDSNFINDQGALDSTFGIRHSALTDTLVATRNTIGISGHTSVFPINVPTRGIQVVSSAAGAGNYAYLANNMIFTTHMKMIDGDTAYYDEDGQNDLSGIDIKGSALTARVLHNTVKLNGVLSSTLSGTVVSSALSIGMTGTGVDYEMYANIFTNERTGGNGLAHNVVVDLYTYNSGMSLEGNTYNASGSGDIARVNNNIYTTMAAYKTQVAPAELTSNDQFVKFADVFDLHLHHSMMGNTNIMVNGLNVVAEDIDASPRSLVSQYRGADEYIVNCNLASLDAGDVEGTDSVCAGDMAELYASNVGTGNGIVYKWQSRPAGSTQPWADVPGEDRTVLMIQVTQPMEFRFVDSCVAGGVVYSQPATVELYPDADITSISEIHIGLNYVFTANGTIPGLVTWDFGDGTIAPGTGNTANHIYTTQGAFTVRAYADSYCSSDTMELVISATTSVNDVDNANGIELYPNPANDNFTIECAAITNGEVRVSLTSLTGTRVYNNTLAADGKRFTTTVDVSTLPAGVYMVELRAGDALYRKNIVVR